MRLLKITALPALTLVALLIVGVSNAHSAGSRHTCYVVHYHAGASHWSRGTTHDPAEESLATTAYAYGAGPCQSIGFPVWSRLIDVVTYDDQALQRTHGSFSSTGIPGTWRLLKTVQVPKSCGGGQSGELFSSEYGYFALSVESDDGALASTGTLKIRLSC